MPDTPFPNGGKVAVVTSWEGGTITDRRMAQMLEQYGYGGTFYLVPNNIGKEGFLNTDDLATMLATGHEIGLHADSLADFATLAPDVLQTALAEAKAQLETITGKPVVSFCYPNTSDWQKPGVADAIRAAGFASARTTHSLGGMTTATSRDTGLYKMPVSAYFRDDFGTIQMGWMDIEETLGGVYHFWGRAAELGESPNDWVDFECILGFLGGISNVWYGTVGDLVKSLA